MQPIDLQSLVTPITSDSPSGPDLEYDPKSVALEDAVRAEPEKQFGDTIVKGAEPDWAAVRDLAVDVLERSKDLRAALYLVQALTHGNGLCGLAQGLALVREMLGAFWDSLHPQLDPSDDFDPTARVNILATLCDSETVLRAVRLAPMVLVPGLGGISLRDLQVARGQAPALEGTKEFMKLDSIEGAFRSRGAEVLSDVAACVENAARDANAIEQLVVERVGVAGAVSLDPLRSTLGEILAFLNQQIHARGGVGALAYESGSDLDNDAAGGQATRSMRTPGSVTCTQDVIDALDKVIHYYKVNEPSSPVPLLLQRAKRLVSLGFMDILRDLAPDALAQAANVTGASAEFET